MSDIVWTSDKIKFEVLDNLIRRKKWGASHTEYIFSGVPKSRWGSKEAKVALKELIRSGWLLFGKKTREIHYSLNSKKMAEIIDFCEKNKD